MDQTETGTWVRPSSDEASFGLKFFKRFWKISKLLFPSWHSPSVWLTFFLLLLSLLEQVIIYYIGLVPSKFYKLFIDKDQYDFLSLVAYSVGLILSETFILSTKLYVASLLYIMWRRSICTAIHDEYFKNINYYKLNILDKTIDNPDQRVTQDVDRMCKTFSQVLVPIIVTPFTICYYVYNCWMVTGYLGPVSSMIFFIIFTVISKLLMSPVARYFYIQEKMEGNFRFQHMQIRINAESAAFYQAEEVEKLKVNQKLERLLSTQSSLIIWQFFLNCCIKLSDYLGSILSYIVIAFPIFSGKYNSLSPADLSSLISQNGFYSMYLINCFTTLVDQSVQMTDVVGTAHRIGQLFEELRRLQNEKTQDNNHNSYITDGRHSVPNNRTSTETSNIILQVHDLQFVQPKSLKILCKNLTFQLSSGMNVLVTGDSGCGKTSLLRIVCGLWNPGAGNIKRYVDLYADEMVCLPQRPYLIDGSLREQVVYPLQELDVTPDDEKIEHYLNLVGLSDLLDRLGGLGLKTDWNWYDELSPGEMQRLSFVRLFYHQPLFAILDEATSQVSEAMEQLLYRTCSELNITFMSVGHRSTVRAYHDMELKLTGDGGWTLTPIEVSS